MASFHAKADMAAIRLSRPQPDIPDTTTFQMFAVSPDRPIKGDAPAPATGSSPHSFATWSRRNPMYCRYSRPKVTGAMHETVIIRRSERTPLAAKASIRLARGAKFEVVVANLTNEGCCIVSKFLNLRAGDFVGLRIANMESWPATVRWSNHTTAGLEFIHPLYGPVAEHLQANFSR
jgi:hypothetical protein